MYIIIKTTVTTSMIQKIQFTMLFFYTNERKSCRQDHICLVFQSAISLWCFLRQSGWFRSCTYLTVTDSTTKVWELLCWFFCVIKIKENDRAWLAYSNHCRKSFCTITGHFIRYTWYSGLKWLVTAEVGTDYSDHKLVIYFLDIIRIRWHGFPPDLLRV